MSIDRFTWFGLGLAILGWVVLIAVTVTGPLLFANGGATITAVMRADIFSIAEMAIASGLALAILGALRSGFGALHRFFDAVLQRANNGPRPAPAPAPTPIVEPVVVAPEPDIAPPRTKPRGKNYTILANGAVEVETLLGNRIFASLEEARDYIR